MEREEKAKKKNRTNPQYQWAAVVFCLIGRRLSAVLSLLSETALDGAGYAVALVVLAVFIGLGIVFDIVGVAVTAADPRPFHSMAAHREKGAKEALFLLRNASRVSSVCNDVVGDICGIVSGTTAAVHGDAAPACRWHGQHHSVRGRDGADLRLDHRRKGSGQELCHEQQHRRGLCRRPVSWHVFHRGR